LSTIVALTIYFCLTAWYLYIFYSFTPSSDRRSQHDKNDLCFVFE